LPRKDKPKGTAINLNAVQPCIETLNGLEIFSRVGIKFESLQRRGPLIRARFSNSVEAAWDTADLIKFECSQAILFRATGLLIETPKVRQIRTTWEPVAQYIRLIVDLDNVEMGADLPDEFKQILRSTYARGGYPIAHERGDVVKILRLCDTHARDAHSEPPQCAAFCAEGQS
jgi:hypothetical protein